ncbi:hypothetical protein P3T73_05010 [Kiritimatiellota bacterium B12222]|nr:hypothetical protein P3T73_05010 [Kiritimatiellota bacterium B12222]
MGVTPLIAQEPPPLQEFDFYVVSSPRFHNIRFGVFDDDGKLVSSKPTGFRSSGRSLRYSYKGPQKIVFFEEEHVPTADNPDAVKRTMVATTRIPSNMEEVLFLFSNNPNFPEKGLKYKLQGVNLAEGNIPQGHVTIFNTMDTEFQGGVQKTKQKANLLTITPGANPSISFYPEASLLLGVNTEDKGFVQVYKETITCESHERMLLILFPPRFPGSMNVGSKLIRLPLSGPEDEEDSRTPKSKN